MNCILFTKVSLLVLFYTYFVKLIKLITKIQSMTLSFLN